MKRIVKWHRTHRAGAARSCLASTTLRHLDSVPKRRRKRRPQPVQVVELHRVSGHDRYIVFGHCSRIPSSVRFRELRSRVQAAGHNSECSTSSKAIPR